MLDSWVHASIWSRGVTETSKVVDVLLPLGGKTKFLCARTFSLFTLCTLLNAVIHCSQHNTQGVLGWFPASGLLVIDAVGLWSMYFVIMPRVNLIVILMTYIHYLYSINCPTIICLPSMLLFILWRDIASELWTPVQFPLHCYTILLLLTLFILLAYYYPFTTRYAQSFVYSKLVRLTTSS
jgi:hypothetical protein